MSTTPAPRPPMRPPPASAVTLPAPLVIKGKSYTRIAYRTIDGEGAQELDAIFSYPLGRKPLALWKGADYAANKNWTTPMVLARLAELAGPTLDACF